MGNYIPLYNEARAIIGAIKSIPDIIQQKENENKLMKSEELCRNVLENIQD